MVKADWSWSSAPFRWKMRALAFLLCLIRTSALLQAATTVFSCVPVRGNGTEEMWEEVDQSMPWILPWVTMVEASETPRAPWGGRPAT